MQTLQISWCLWSGGPESDQAQRLIIKSSRISTVVRRGKCPEGMEVGKGMF